MTTIVADVTRMFLSNEPWDCSNSIANLGPCAGRLTWESALAVARSSHNWLVTPIGEACSGMREWALASGGWDAEEIAAMEADELLGLFVQNVASELRMLGSDDVEEFAECVARYESTDWDEMSDYPIGCYYLNGDAVRVDYHTGV